MTSMESVMLSPVIVSTLNFFTRTLDIPPNFLWTPSFSANSASSLKSACGSFERSNVKL